MLSSDPDGKTSNGTTRLLGSGVPTLAPFTCVELYRSPRPRTYTYRPPTTESPVTRCSASAAFESVDFEICSDVMVSVTYSAFFCLTSDVASELWRSCP